MVLLAGCYDCPASAALFHGHAIPRPAFSGNYESAKRCLSRRRGSGRSGVSLLSRMGALVGVAHHSECLRCDLGLVPRGLAPEIALRDDTTPRRATRFV